MKEVYDTYLESHFLSLNSPTKRAFEHTAKAYAKWYKKFLPPNRSARILDIGCGMGHFLYFLKCEGYRNFLGIDISRQQVDFTKENITGSVVVADAFDFLGKECFEVIVLNDLLEHIPKNKLMEFLHMVFNSLENSGVVFIKVPNMSNPFGLRSRYITITHEVGFTEYSLLEVLKTIGFQDILITPAYPPVLSAKSLLGKTGQAIIHQLFRLLFLIQGYGVPKIMTSNIIAIAKKAK